MEIPYISLHDFAAINDSMRTRVRHFDPNFWQWSMVPQLLRAGKRLFVVNVVALVVTFSSSTVSQLLRTKKRLFVVKVVPSTSQEGRSYECKSSLLVSWIKCLFPLSISLFRSRRAVTKLLFSSRIDLEILY